MIEWLALGFCCFVLFVGLGMVTLVIPAQLHPCTIPMWGMSDNQLWQFIGAFISTFGWIGILLCVAKLLLERSGKVEAFTPTYLV